ncbi:aceric acid hydrolase [Rhizosphaericola mali]|uniref:Glycoside hydrolase family 127 protein n=1 Tax=Rhizosphaericola mali TaxID=2545455 RepID=A0A5P2FYL4_9BACT|nr:glycoside hydrolase family 127 protein [Rhizosphaericola mali]QES88596.1 glycoside hydrolase family 127 protein [Rhizosphaericola mali]
MKIFLLSIIFCLLLVHSKAQEKALVDTKTSQYSQMKMLDMGSVHWTDGFWYNEFQLCKNTMIPTIWRIYNDPTISHSFRNFEIAASLDTGSFVGPSFHDGDFYKVLEALAAMYATTKDTQLDNELDKAIAVIVKAQRKDGYLYTKSIIDHQKMGKSEMFDDKLSFEAYNFGHLMTAACVHYRATGKRSLLDVAIKATNFLLSFYNHATPEQARNAICPSHYMGIIEMYRTVQDPRYLQLAEKLLLIRGTPEGTEDNSDRVAFRKMEHAGGHAVRANYLFAGAADLFAETGDTSLIRVLDKMWNDVTFRKMYITGGCGALYDGVSPDGTSYNPDTVQRVHQSYGRAFQLPLKTAHNETCANIGNLLWNWRMFLNTGDAKYMDIVELELYNGILSGVSLDGDKYFYTNALEHNAAFPYTLRWAGGRQKYIALSNCCPPNIVRTIAEVPNYVYTVSKNNLFVNLYGSNQVELTLDIGKKISLEQKTNYPWDGLISLKINDVSQAQMGINFRIPNWCTNYSVRINGSLISNKELKNGFCVINRVWKNGDIVELNLDMPTNMMESNPLVEESRSRVAVKKGPVVYCLETKDLPDSVSVFDVTLDASQVWKPITTNIKGYSFTSLQGNFLLQKKQSWNNSLYRPISHDNSSYKKIQAKLIPYFAWANRGDSDMSVWLPYSTH